jgi:hypothetical protein
MWLMLWTSSAEMVAPAATFELPLQLRPWRPRGILRERLAKLK